MSITYTWRGAFTNTELNELHAEAFETHVYDEAEWNGLERFTGTASVGWSHERARYSSDS